MEYKTNEYKIYLFKFQIKKKEYIEITKRNEKL